MEDDSFAAAANDDATTTTIPHNPLLNLTNNTSSSITPSEQDVLDEYTRLLNNMNQVSHQHKPLHIAVYYHSLNRNALQHTAHPQHTPPTPSAPLPLQPPSSTHLAYHLPPTLPSFLTYPLTLSS